MTELMIGLSLLIATGIFVLLVSVLNKLKSDKSTGLESLIRNEFGQMREESGKNNRELREEVNTTQKSAIDSVVRTISELGGKQGESLARNTKQVQELMESNSSQLGNFSQKVEEQLKNLQQNNEKKLEEMRVTVDEKLQSTLEKRLGESFKLVSERLEAVQRGLGEMQTLATGVGDLKRVLTNVKARGTWGEVQLGAILEEILTPEQYEKNVCPKPDSREAVEFAVCFPGKDDQSKVYLPIDSKFPQEDYLRLVDASESGDVEAVQQATARLLRTIRSAAKDISTKYIAPPHTTDFAIMFLPTEGLYAEVLRQSGEIEFLQQNNRVVIAGPTTLSAILNSFRMGFRTLAIEKRSSEVWEVLGAVKTEFGKFGTVLEKVKKQLSTASKTLESTGVRTRVMEQKLQDVEALPCGDADLVLEVIEPEQNVLELA